MEKKLEIYNQKKDEYLQQNHRVLDKCVLSCGIWWRQAKMLESVQVNATYKTALWNEAQFLKKLYFIFINKFDNWNFTGDMRLGGARGAVVDIWKTCFNVRAARQDIGRHKFVTPVKKLPAADLPVYLSTVYPAECVFCRLFCLNLGCSRVWNGGSDVNGHFCILVKK